MKIEIEKKFLLKELPIIPYSEIQHIIQYYYLVNDVWYRIRKINSDKQEKNGTGDVYLHTIKTYKDGIIFPFEEECYYTYDNYKKLLAEIHSGKYDVRYISKTRYIYKTGIIADFEGEQKEIKWEVDSFNFNLIIIILKKAKSEWAIVL